MVAAVQPTGTAPDLRLVTEIRGAPAKLFSHSGGDVVISGPMGTGKTRAILEWIHRRCATEKIRVLLLRKTLESLKASALVTYQEQVLHEFDGKQSKADGVSYYGGSNVLPAEFRYAATGSRVIVGGLDKASKVLSTEYDVIYINEVTELSLDEWEKITGRTDRPTMDDGKPANLVVGDCNPDAPTHWIKVKERDSALSLWYSVHKDNPAMWDRKRKEWTESGKRYIQRLQRMTGVRRARNLEGKWVAAEGQVYEMWDTATHLVDRFDIPYQWPRYWVIDFGYVHPFVWQWWAEGPDGALYRYREIYMTRRLVEDHAKKGAALSANEPPPMAVIVDHDAEDRATFERHAGVTTTAAKKTVRDGIQAVASRLRTEGNGRARLFFMRDSLVERDRELVESAHPTSTEEEFLVYVWGDTKPGAERKADEQPIKKYDHGMDATRYLVAHFDLDGSGDYSELDDYERLVFGGA